MNRLVIRYGITLILCLLSVIVLFILFKTESLDKMYLQSNAIVIGVYFIIYSLLVTVISLISKKEVLTVIIGLGLTVLIAGKQFSIQHWPGGKELIVIGIILIGIFLALLMYNKLTKTN